MFSFPSQVCEVTVVELGGRHVVDSTGASHEIWRSKLLWEIGLLIWVQCLLSIRTPLFTLVQSSWKKFMGTSV